MKILSLLVSLLIIFSFTTDIFADKRSQKEVTDMVKETETKLEAVIDEGAELYAAAETAAMQDYINKAKKFLDEGERDLAFYEISKAKAYIRLIKAQRDLMDADSELTNAQDNKDK
jgi:hypothetical protein